VEKSTRFGVPSPRILTDDAWGNVQRTPDKCTLELIVKIFIDIGNVFCYNQYVNKTTGKRVSMMIITAMLILNWAFITYFEIPFVAMIPLMTTGMIWFTCGWKYGRQYEKEQTK